MINIEKRRNKMIIIKINMNNKIDKNRNIFKNKKMQMIRVLKIKIKNTKRNSNEMNKK